MKTLSTTPTSPTTGHLLDTGLLARPSGAADVRERTDTSGGGVGRVLDVRVRGGLDIEVWPDRGLDIGPAWYRGEPVAWTSPVGRGTPTDVPRGTDWLQRFRGGLVTTCGTDNVGPPTDTAGLHGRHSSLPATEVSWSRFRDGDAVVCRVVGTIEDVAMFGRRIVVVRSIETRTDSALVLLRDRIENRGYSAVPVPLLYHVNLGAPLLQPGTRVHVDCRETVAREPAPWVPDHTVLPEPGDGPEEAVFEHLDPVGAGGRTSVRVDPPGLDFTAEVSFSNASLPRLYQWVWPARNGWALGIEPANAALFGPGRDRPGQDAPLLGPGESIDTEVQVALLPRGARPTDGRS